MQQAPGSTEKRGWRQRFGDAFRGWGYATLGQPSFQVHGVAAVAVVVCGLAWGACRWEWCILLLCIAMVMTAEAFNSALEWLARAVDTQHNPHLAAALDSASGAVLISALGAALVGTLVLGYRLGVVCGWWPASVP